jgi:hypothetical protein
MKKRFADVHSAQAQAVATERIEASDGAIEQVARCYRGFDHLSACAEVTA